MKKEFITCMTMLDTSHPQGEFRGITDFSVYIKILHHRALKTQWNQCLPEWSTPKLHYSNSWKTAYVQQKLSGSSVVSGIVTLLFCRLSECRLNHNKQANPALERF
jgi:hypothetical protein